MNTTEIAKFNMIEQQIRPWEVLDHQVLSTLEQLNREDFVQEAYKGLAYADCQIPLANGVRMLPPNVEGRMLQALLLGDDDQVLEVGSGCGYISACLASLAGHVKSIDADADIIERARTNIASLGLDRIEFEQMSLTQLDVSESFDAIAVTASLPALPQNLKQALTIGGRMFIICGYSPAMEALLITRVSTSEWTTQSLFETDLPRLQVAG
jgi:protein-L-isoaspartate(D-aspartate) O-methyltransferase